MPTPFNQVQSTNNFLPEEVQRIIAVKAVIKAHLEDFNLTIGKLGRHMTTSYFVSGGCIASILQREQPKDYDVFFISEFVAKPIVELYTNDPSYMGEVALWEEKYHDVATNGMMITSNAVTLKNGIQLITKHYGTPEEIRRTFDFVHCMPYYNSSDDKLYISREQYDCCVNKHLVINNSANLTKWREEKFMKRGYYYGNPTN